MTFQELYQDRYQRLPITPTWRPIGSAPHSDIVLHLPVLEYFASLCKHVTEFGVREGHSTVALIAGCSGKVVSYDIERSPVVSQLTSMDLPCKSWEFNEADTISPRLFIEPTDLLFIDTLHTYAHVQQELKLHGDKAGRFLAFHDTETCGVKDVSGTRPNAPGILPAIYEYVDGHFKLVYQTKANNGLMVFERI